MISGINSNTYLAEQSHSNKPSAYQAEPKVTASATNNIDTRASTIASLNLSTQDELTAQVDSLIDRKPSLAANTAQADWHTTHSEVDLRIGGRFVSRMEAKDGSAAFDFEGVYTNIVPQQLIEFNLADGRKVKVEFIQASAGVMVQEVFDVESEHSTEQQREGWQAILHNFASYVERNQ